MLKYISSRINGKRKSANDEVEYEKSILYDIYILVLVFVVFCNGLLNVFFLKLYLYASIFFGIGLFFLSILMWPDRIRFNKNGLMAFFMLLGILTFCCDILGGKESMNYLSYIPLMIALSFFFDYNKDKYRIFILIVCYITFFLINAVTNYSIFPDLSLRLSEVEQQYVKICKIIEVSLFVFVGMYFIYRKERMIVKYHIEKEKLNELVRKTEQINLSDGLYELAMSKNSLFITHFKHQFPDFFENVLKFSPNIIASELEICALLKLNLSTKEISTATNSTIRSVENKKYRIRRKLDIPSETDLNLFIINTF